MPLPPTPNEPARTAALLITPYYKPTQEGLYQHYAAVARAVDLPLILYNIPGRTSVNMTPATIARIAKLPNVVGIKEGSGSLGQVSEIIHQCGDELTVLSGDDPLTLPMMALGGQGRDYGNRQRGAERHGRPGECRPGRELRRRARASHFKLTSLFNALFYETNPIPVKEALAMMNKIEPELRLPLTPLSSDNRERLRQVMKDTGLI